MFVAVAAASFTPPMVVQAALPDIEAAQCTGTGGTIVNGKCVNDETTKTIPEVISSVLSALLFLVGLAAIIMLIVAGIKLTTSGGDQAAVKSAKSTITAAVVGLVIAFLAYAVVAFVTTNILPPPSGGGGGTHPKMPV